MIAETEVRRGDIWWVSFDAAIGGEIRKTRPAIIVSNDSANRHLNRVQVIPVTSNVANIYPGEACVVVDRQRSKAMSDQLTTVSKLRLKEKIATLSSTDLLLVETAIRQQLGL